MENIIQEMEQYAKTYHVPIIEKESLDYLLTFLKENQIKKVLEVGTAIGYSAIQMALNLPDLKITSIERDIDRYQEAVENVRKAKLESRITLLYQDALDCTLEDTFDLIFLDAAKAQNINFFNHFEKNLSSKGYFITDNIFFHGMVEKDESEIESRNVRGIVRKTKAYLAFLEENKNYHTEIIKIGDGLAISERT